MRTLYSNCSPSVLFCHLYLSVKALCQARDPSRHFGHWKAAAEKPHVYRKGPGRWPVPCFHLPDLAKHIQLAGPNLLHPWLEGVWGMEFQLFQSCCSGHSRRRVG